MAATPSEINALLAQARCMDCYPAPIQSEIQTYIMAVVAGQTTDPIALAKLAKCMTCLSTDTLLRIKAYLLARISSPNVRAQTLIDDSNCYECIPEGFLQSVETYKILHDPQSPSADPAAVSRLARCFGCLSPQTLLEVQVYLLALIARLDPNVNELIDESNVISEIPVTIIRRVITREVVDVEDGGGLSGCTDVLADLVPVITVNYVAGMASTIDILFPKVCCEILSFTIYESNNADMSAATDVAVLPMTGALPGEENFTISGADVSTATKTYLAVKQNCLNGTVSDYSNVEPRVEPACAAGQVVAEDWADRVEVNGGARPSQPHIDAAAKFYCALMTAGIHGKMRAVNILAPDNLIAAITPFIATVGSDPWVNSNFVLADLTVNGLKGNGLNKVLATGVTPNLTLGIANAGLTAYCFEFPSGGTESYIGAKDAANTSQGDLLVSGGSVYFDTWNFTTGRIIFAIQGAGYYSGNRIAANSTDLYFAKAATPHSSIVHGVTAGGVLPDLQLVAFALTDYTGFPIFFASTRISFLAIHFGLTTAESSAFFNAIQALRTAFGGGFV